MINKKDLNRQFQEIIEKHKGILFKVARTYCLDDEDRQDLIQEVKIQIWRSLHNYNDKYKMTTWLYRISLNVAISFYRKNAGKKVNTIPLDEQISRISEADNSDKVHQLQLLDQFINELNEFDKALMLLYLEEKSHAEIADILGISVSNVSTKAGRIKNKLKKRFSNES